MRADHHRTGNLLPDQSTTSCQADSDFNSNFESSAHHNISGGAMSSRLSEIPSGYSSCNGRDDTPPVLQVSSELVFTTVSIIWTTCWARLGGMPRQRISTLLGSWAVRKLLRFKRFNKRCLSQFNAFNLDKTCWYYRLNCLSIEPMWGCSGLKVYSHSAPSKRLLRFASSQRLCWLKFQVLVILTSPSGARHGSGGRHRLAGLVSLILRSNTSHVLDHSLFIFGQISRARSSDEYLYCRWKPLWQTAVKVLQGFDTWCAQSRCPCIPSCIVYRLLIMDPDLLTIEDIDTGSTYHLFSFPESWYLVVKFGSAYPAFQACSWSQDDGPCQAKRLYNLYQAISDAWWSFLGVKVPVSLRLDELWNEPWKRASGFRHFDIII